MDHLSLGDVHIKDKEPATTLNVGRNTKLVDGEWLPTFPNSQYVFSSADADYWNPSNRGDGFMPDFEI